MIDDLMQQAWFAQSESNNLNEVQIKSTKKGLTHIVDNMAEYREDVTHVKANGDLSPNGKQVKINDLAQTTENRLAGFVNPELAQLDKRIAELEEKTRPQQPAGDVVLEFLRQREIRDRLVDMDELKIVGLYQSLATSGKDDLAMRAIEESPAAFPLISDAAILAAGKAARGERHNPKSKELLEQLKSMRSMLSAAFNSARAELGLKDGSLEAIAAGTA